MEKIYSKEECEEMIPKMKAVSSNYYYGAIQTGCHAFIEFNGLMNKFIEIFKKTVGADQDPNTANIHIGQDQPD